MVKLIMAGDSTAATKMTDKRPETGWGEKYQPSSPQRLRSLI